MKNLVILYEVSFFSALWMVFPESWKRIAADFYAHDCICRMSDMLYIRIPFFLVYSIKSILCMQLFLQIYFESHLYSLTDFLEKRKLFLSQRVDKKLMQTQHQRLIGLSIRHRPTYLLCRDQEDSIFYCQKS